MRRSDVPTPALLVDIDILDRNITLMRDCSTALGVKLRPHAKAHKCVEIAQRIMAAGAIGASCATIGEAEAMASGGIGGILVTAPLTSADAIQRLRRLLLRGADIAVVADHPASVGQLSAVAATSGRTLDVVVDVDVGMDRTGCLEIADVVALAADHGRASPQLCRHPGLLGQSPAGQSFFRALATDCDPGRSGARRRRRIG
ncbi:MAG: alanine racemase, partial [Rhodomicrobium sp.]